MKIEEFQTGKIALLEKEFDGNVEIVVLSANEFRYLLECETNYEKMNSCIQLLGGLQICIGGEKYKLVHGLKLVIDIFVEYTQYYIDSVKEIIDEYKYKYDY
jgi:hypothetical protein